MDKIHCFILSEGNMIERKVAFNTVTIELSNLSPIDINLEEFVNQIQNVYGDCVYMETHRRDFAYLMYAYSNTIVFNSRKEMFDSVMN